jgi:hypothetical protein
MSCSVERFLHQYDKNREACELECDSLELACRHLEWAQAYPKGIWSKGVLIMNLNQIINEWMQRHYNKLGHFKSDVPKA